jgi:general secretion pathway protein D
MIVQYTRGALKVSLAILLLLPLVPLVAKTRKGDKLRNEARTEELKGNYDHALELAEQAVKEDASDPAYLLEARRVRFEAGVAHVSNGHRMRDGGHLEEALAEFQKAYSIDPSSDMASQEVKRTKEMIEREKNGGAEPIASISREEQKTLTPVQLARRQSELRSDSLLPVAELRPLNSDLIDLKMINQRPRVLFETVAKVAGVNVLFDPEYDQQQTLRAVSIDLTRTTLDQALDQLSVITKSFWKPLSSNTIFITVDNPNKRREYAEQVVKVFYLSNLTSPQEMQEMLTVLRTVVDVQKVFSYTGQNALIVRAESDTMALVEKLISDLDKPRPEVVIDVMVMEVSSTYMRSLTAAFASTGITTNAVFAPRPGITTPGIQSTSTGTTSTTTTGITTTTTPTTTGTTPTTTGGSTGATTIPLSALGRISSADYSITSLPGATFEAVLSDSSTRVLQAPQIRAVSNVKAELKIGTKVPTASGSFQAGTATVGVSPLVNTQFTYLDVGVNLNVLPIVMDNSEVSMHIDLDISQVNTTVNLGGINEPEIGQNKLTTDIRLKDGQVNLIGGIIQQTDSKTLTGIPGLASIPVLGRLFSGSSIEKDRTELVIALIPHIVRGQDIDATNIRGIAAGNATQIKVNFAPRPAPAGSQPPQEVRVTTPATTLPSPVGTIPQAPGPPITAPVAIPPGLLGGPPATAPPDNNATIPTPATGPARISFQPPAVTTQLGSTVTVIISGDNISDMISAAAQLRYNPAILRINNIVAGDLPQRNVSTLTPTRNILNDSGQTDMSVSRGPQDGGVSGSGGLFTVVFQTVGRGNTNVSIGSIALTGSTGQPMAAVAPTPLVVNVN